LVTDAEATAAQSAVFDSVRRPDGRVLNIFRALATHADLTRRWLVFGNHVLAKSTLPPRVRELAILRVGWLCHSEYEWGQHVLIAREVGITDEEIGRLKLDPGAGSWSDAERGAIQAADELFQQQQISDDTWRALCGHYDERQRVDLVFTVGQYVLVSMALNTFEVPRDEGVPGFED
jgi:alkylhydroperoxidase family enzyme